MNLQTVHNPPVVSVVLPTYNRRHLLPRAIQSVLTQTLLNFELIVVDDGSMDNTVDLIEGLSDHRIRLLSLPRNYGGGYARNVGVLAARADLVAFLDSDDEWAPEKLELQVARLNSSTDPYAAVVYCRYKQFDEFGSCLIPPIQTRRYQGDILGHLMEGWCVYTSFVMVKRSALINVGGFDISLPSSQEYDLWLRLAKASNHFVFVDKILGTKHNHSDEQCISNDLAAVLRGFEIIQSKWGPTVKEHLSSSKYRQWVAKRSLRINTLQIIKSLRDRNRKLALRYFLASWRYLSFSNLIEFRRPLMLVLLGDGRIYRAVHKTWRQINHPFQD